ncbi:MAG: hypothetical protein ACYC27_18720 [Armatimonadota bacterium]
MLSNAKQAFALPKTVEIEGQKIIISPLTILDMIDWEDAAVEELKRRGEYMLDPVTPEDEDLQARQISRELKSSRSILDYVYRSLIKKDPELTKEQLVEVLGSEEIGNLFGEIFMLTNKIVKNEEAPEATVTAPPARKQKKTKQD